MDAGYGAETDLRISRRLD